MSSFNGVKGPLRAAVVFMNTAGSRWWSPERLELCWHLPKLPRCFLKRTKLEYEWHFKTMWKKWIPKCSSRPCLWEWRAHSAAGRTSLGGQRVETACSFEPSPSTYDCKLANKISVHDFKLWISFTFFRGCFTCTMMEKMRSNSTTPVDTQIIVACVFVICKKTPLVFFSERNKWMFSRFLLHHNF